MHTIHRSGRDTDAELVAAAKCGDVHAFEKLVLRHERKVLAAAQRITNNREEYRRCCAGEFSQGFSSPR